MTRLMLSCGEASGDLYAGALVAALRRREPDIDVFGLGGERFRAAGGRLIADFHGLSVTGLTEALSVIPRSFATMRRLVAAAKQEKPHALVVIDYPDFNFRLLWRIKKLGIPVIYYVSPQLWAWRAGRIRLMKRAVDRVLPIFPFEEGLYQREQIDVRFVGHPLIDLARPVLDRESFLRKLNLDPARPVLALLPGSRANELERLGISTENTPTMSIVLDTPTVSVVDMADAYLTFANRGVQVEPTLVTMVTNAGGDVLWRHAPAAKRVLDAPVPG